MLKVTTEYSLREYDLALDILFMFFTSVNHVSGPLGKQKLT